MTTSSQSSSENSKRNAARLSLGSNLTLLLLKLGVGLMSGSVSVLSEAAHSGSDLIASALTLFSVHIVDLPPDEEHPYGHGKVEGLSTLGQGLLLTGVTAYIVYEAIHRLLHHEAAPKVGWGMAVMGVSAIINVFVVRVVRRVAQQTDSLALEAVSKDHLADIYAAGGVLVGLILVHITGQSFFDSLLALAVASLILHSAWSLLRDGSRLLMDTQLPLEEVKAVRRILDDEPSVLDYHKLRTRKSGSVRLVDAHILLDDDLTLLQAHDLTEAVEDRIRAALPNTEVTLHMEPYQAEQQHQKQIHRTDAIGKEE